MERNRLSPATVLKHPGSASGSSRNSQLHSLVEMSVCPSCPTSRPPPVSTTCLPHLPPPAATTTCPFTPPVFPQLRSLPLLSDCHSLLQVLIQADLGTPPPVKQIKGVRVYSGPHSRLQFITMGRSRQQELEDIGHTHAQLGLRE